jgi:hypothetical protein
MYIDDANLKKPDENAKIWRYMDYSKFLSLLDKSALFFARADRLGDPFEGSYSKANVKIRPITYKDWPTGNLRYLSQYHELLPRFTAVNCWHINEHDSAAMWKLYFQDNAGIAIQSTFRRLKDSFEKEKEHKIYIGKVEYIDFENELMSHEGYHYAFLFKRRSFEHEQELRAIIQSIPLKTRGKDKGHLNFDKPLCKEGIPVLVDLNTLVDKVYLPPTSHEWQIELIRSVISRYSLDKMVSKSTLYDQGSIVY